MHRPESTDDAIALVRRSRVVDDARLGEFLNQVGEVETAAGVLGRMVDHGLLTRYQAAELAAGRCDFRIGGYRILDRLGRGGMGEVFLAEHHLLGTRAAVKVLCGGRADEPTRERFVREARAAAALDHPNIVRVFDVDAAHDPPYLVLEYVDGISLQAAVARHGTFSGGEAAAVGAQVALGLGQAAEIGLVHRDIKPANVLIGRKGGVKILDLGVARFTNEPVSRFIDGETVVGTIDYLAPEQAVDSSNVDTRADLYALGATLYFLLAGHPPFPDADLPRKLHLKQTTDPSWIAAHRPDIPAGLAAVVHRLLARRPADRFPTPGEAAAALAPWADPDPDFPDRLFRPAAPAGNELAGDPTISGDDPNPTQLPPTRRILRSQTERQPTAAGVSDITPLPALPAPAVADADSPTRFPPPPHPAAEIDDSGNPTVVLHSGTARPPTLNVMWLVVLAAALAAAVIGGVAAARVPDCSRNSGESPGPPVRQ